METQSLERMRRTWNLPDEVDDPAWESRRRLAEALRDLSLRCVTTRATPERLAAAVERLRSIESELTDAETTTFLDAWRDGSYFDAPEQFADRSLLVGRSNPFAPPLAIHHEGDVTVAQVRFSELFVGGPGMVHGGIVSAAFDQLFGSCLIQRTIGALTVQLTVRYLLPTPLERELRFEARLVREEGRSCHLEGRCLDGDRVTAEADAVFTRIGSDHMRRIAGEPSTDPPSGSPR